MPKLTVKITPHLKTKEVQAKVKKASARGLKDCITDIANETIKGSPVDTGNNMRSIKYEVGPGAEVAKKEGEGAVYSTSGYGGFLETGTRRMGPRPYFRPALDRFGKNLPNNIRAHLK